MKTKAETCKYNTNRLASKIANPYCVYGLSIKLPPKMFIQGSNTITASDCGRCKCYERIEE